MSAASFVGETKAHSRVAGTSAMWIRQALWIERRLSKACGLLMNSRAGRSRCDLARLQTVSNGLWLW